MTCYNRKESTKKCLSALYQNKGNFWLKVFLVDDGSTDGTKEMIAGLFPDVTIIQGSGNLFWNRGMYLSWARATEYNCGYFLWLNDDTILFPNAIASLIHMINCCKSPSIIVGTLMDSEGRISYGGHITGKANNDILIPQKDKIIKCDFFNGNCVLVPRQVYDILGNLDYHFKHGIGDYEYGYRANKYGINCIISMNFIGICNRNEEKDKTEFLSNKLPLKQRIKLLYSPLGQNPFEVFYFSRKYHSFFYAIGLFCKLHLNLLFKLHD
jgi:GT2 family glycosyltransferase